MWSPIPPSLLANPIKRVKAAISRFALLNGVWNAYLNLQSTSLRRFLISDMIPQILKMGDVTPLQSHQGERNSQPCDDSFHLTNPGLSSTQFIIHSVVEAGFTVSNRYASVAFKPTQ